MTTKFITSLPLITSVNTSTHYLIGDNGVITGKFNLQSLITQNIFASANQTGISSIVDMVDVSISTLTDGDILIWNASAAQWQNGSNDGVTTSLAGLANVSLSTLADGNILVYNASSGQFQNQPNTGSGATSIAGLDNVSISTLAQDNLLVYNASAGQFQNQPRNAAITSVDTRLTNVSAAIDGHVDTTSAALNARATSIVSRLATVSAKGTSVNTYIGTVSGNVTSVNNRVANVSAIVPVSLRDLANVSISILDQGHILVWNASAGQFQNQPLSDIGVTSIAGLTDVSISTVVQDNLLVYNASAGQWQNQPRNAAIASVDTRLTNVSAAIDGHIDTTSAALNARSTSIVSRLATVSAKGTSVNTRLTNVSAAIDGHVDSTSAALNSRSTSIVSRLATVSAKGTSINTRINTVSANSASVNNQVVLIKGQTSVFTSNSVAVTPSYANWLLNLSYSAGDQVNLVINKGSWKAGDTLTFVRTNRSTGYTSISDGGTSITIQTAAATNRVSGQYAIGGLVFINSSIAILTGDIV